MPFDEIRMIAHAERAGGGAAVRVVEVERVPNGVGYPAPPGDAADAEELHGVEARDPGHVIEGEALDRRDRRGRMADIRGLVPLAAHRLRAKIRRIRFDEQALERYLPYAPAKRFRLGERDRPGDGDGEPHLRRRTGHVP